MSKWGKATPVERKQAPEAVFCGPGRSFPVADKEDFDNAVQALGRSKGNASAIKSCIAGKAQENGWTLPASFTAINGAPVQPSGKNVIVQPFSMEGWKDAGTQTVAGFDMLGAAFEQEFVIRQGKVFAVGEYPDKNFSASPEELVVAAVDFEGVPNKVLHHDPQIQPTYFDGHLGTLRKVEFAEDGETLVGTVAIPRWFDTFMKQAHPGKPLSVSLEFDRETKRIVGNTLVPNPRIADSALIEAFAVHRGVQTIHDMTVAHGASCDATDEPTAAGMAVTHEQMVQKFHNVTKAHGAQCVPAQAPMSNPPKPEVMELKLADGATYKFTLKDGVPVPVDNAPPPAQPKEEPSVEMAALVAENKKLSERLDAQDRERRMEKAISFAESVIAELKEYPASKEYVVNLALQAQIDDAAGSANFDGHTASASRFETLKAMYAAKPKLMLTQELVQDEKVLQMMNQMETQKKKEKDGEVDKAKVDRLLTFTDTGRQILAERVSSN